MQVLEWYSIDYSFLRHLASKLVFIDEFRLLATTSVPVKNEHELNLVIFDTSIPRQSPDSWEPFNIVPRHPFQHPRSSSSWDVTIYTDWDRTQGEGSCDGPLIVDPTQSVVVLSLNGRGVPLDEEIILVVRTTALFRQLPSALTCRRILWDEWKRDAMIITLPRGIFSGRIFVFGPRVLLATRKWIDEDGEGYSVQVYNCSRWGCRALVQVGSGRKEKTLVLNPEKVWFTDEYRSKVGYARALGDSIVWCGVSDSVEPLKHTVDSCLVREDFGVPW